MQLGMVLERASTFAETGDHLAEFEAAGVDLVSVPEAYGFDAVSQLGYLAARTSRMTLLSGILQIYTRSPTLTAMTAAGLDHVSGGRFILGLGASGPGVISGFHGLPFDAPWGRTREVIEICRRTWTREPLHYEGKYYSIPRSTAADGSPGGEGLRELKLSDTPLRSRIPVSIAALGPRNVALAAEIAESWQPVFFSPERVAGVWSRALAEGTAKRDPSLGPLGILIQVRLGIDQHADEALDSMRRQLAMYIGGMGTRQKNFYKDLAGNYGYADEAQVIQDAYLSGDRAKAVAAVPDDLARSVSLIGTRDDVRAQLAAFAAAGVTCVIVRAAGADHAERLAQIELLRALIDEGSAES